ncbi:TetR/AcrR family transcriptional regulator [Demequina globuliformis]|uniref:TetR/AcrR family transcriptional regulator n=1 Tax=Demequina globuliformis TaxID=676202 RepID=UPI000A07135A|nr:TetR/AcrR family transcriptional regulator [Demequina globuliformis]
MTTSQARDRIIDAALRLFAERGSEAVSIRDIAAAVGVSPALIPHHFGSKAGLIEAVDATVVGVFDALRDVLLDPATAPGTADVDAQASGLAAAMARHLPQASPVFAYLRRALLDGSDAGRSLFRQWFTMTQELLAQMDAAGATRSTPDPPARAAFVLANDLSLLLLHEHIGDALGTDPLTEPGMTRLATAATHAYTHGIFTAPTVKEDS